MTTFKPLIFYPLSPQAHGRLLGQNALRPTSQVFLVFNSPHTGSEHRCRVSSETWATSQVGVLIRAKTSFLFPAYNGETGDGHLDATAVCYSDGNEWGHGQERQDRSKTKTTQAKCSVFPLLRHPLHTKYHWLTHTLFWPLSACGSSMSVAAPGSLLIVSGYNIETRLLVSLWAVTPWPIDNLWFAVLLSG